MNKWLLVGAKVALIPFKLILLKYMNYEPKGPLWQTTICVLQS